MTTSEVPHGKAILASLPGDSSLGRVRIRGVWREPARSKIQGGTAFILELNDSSKDVLRVHTADPRFVLVDLETLPSSRLPGMTQYIGGAFVTIYGKQVMGDLLDSSSFTKYLGTAEVLARETQELLEIPQAAHAHDAALVVARAKVDFSVDLEFDIRSLEKAAEILTRVGLSGVPSEVHLGRLLAMWGSYFGESLIHDFGGQWHLDPRLGNVVLLPRSSLPPVKVNPYGVVEDMMRTGDRSRLRQWLAQIESARRSSDFRAVVVE